MVFHTSKSDFFDQSDITFLVVIPCFNEPNILQTIHSLQKCHTKYGYSKKVGVVVVVNRPRETTDEIQENTARTISILKETELPYPLLVLECIFDNKIAGVGMARKTGMDLAASFFEFHKKNSSGYIICLDADCLVSENYLFEIELFIQKHPKVNAFNIYYEHRIPPDEKQAQGIILYELHLRYYMYALRYAGHPHAFQTVGSSMAVRADVYKKMGGMNTLKAGEDFYFLKKIIPLGNFGELQTCCVFPDGRTSARVPFGTGRAMLHWMAGYEIMSYNFESFVALKRLFELLPKCTDNENVMLSEFLLHPLVIQFLYENDFTRKWREIYRNANSKTSRIKRFFAWFDLFMAMKYVHYMRRHPNFEDKPVLICAKEFYANEGNVYSKQSPIDLLLWFRNKDKNLNNIYVEGWVPRIKP